MKKKLALICCLALTLTLTATACGNNDEDTYTSSNTEVTDTADSASKSPLSDKEYPDLKIKIKKNTNIDDIIIKLIQEYNDNVNLYTKYSENHAFELSKGMTIADAGDFEEYFEGWYKWFYKIKSVDENDIPDDYKPIWSDFRKMANYDKPRLDAIYNSDFIGMRSYMNEIFEYNTTCLESLTNQYDKLLANAQ